MSLQSPITLAVRVVFKKSPAQVSDLIHTVASGRVICLSPGAGDFGGACESVLYTS
ncbi:MAG: hypothetical protein ABI690_04550 [Chloroflexota bacterium]